MTHLSIYTVQQSLDCVSRTTDYAYAGWNVAFPTLEAAKEAVLKEYAELSECEPDELPGTWTEVEDGRWLWQISDAEFGDDYYTIVRATLS